MHQRASSPRTGTGGQLAAASDPALYSAFGQQFAGGLDLSDIIADYNPELGDTLRALAAVFQAAIEQSVAAQFPEIREASREPGYPNGLAPWRQARPS